MIKFIKNLNGFLSKSSEKGFSLAEVMIAIGITGILIVATISQLKLSSKSATNMASDAEINNLTNKIISAIGTPSICSENFKNQSPNKPDYTKLVNGGATIVAVGTSVGTSAGEVQVSKIATKKLSNNEMTLILSFSKKQFSLGTFLSSGPTREIPINIVLNTALTQVDFCFANYDLLIKTAIQQACKGNSSFYNENVNKPYGQCEHNNQLLACNINGQFLKTVSFTANEIQYTCGKITADCLPGQAVTGYNADGTATCNYALTACGAGFAIVKSSSGAHVCTKIDCSTITPLSAFSGFNPDGSIICTPVTATKSCPIGQWASGTTADGTITCSTATFAGGSCPVGQRIQGIKADGTPNCVAFINLPASCPGGMAVTGVNSLGNITCSPINRPLACDGTKSNHTYASCSGVGALRNVDSTSSHCVVSGSSCPAGWTPCGSYASYNQGSCVDTSNTYYCAGNQITRYANAPDGNGNYGTSGPGTVTCYSWNGASNNNKACSPVPYTTGTTPKTQIGCY